VKPSGKLSFWAAEGKNGPGKRKPVLLLPNLLWLSLNVLDEPVMLAQMIQY
jgi:hypothetical protein